MHDKLASDYVGQVGRR